MSNGYKHFASVLIFLCIYSQAANDFQIKQRFGTDPYKTHVLPRIRDIVETVCRSAAEEMCSLIYNGTPHELFGFDLLVDQQLNVWLLEANACPDLTHSTVRQNRDAAAVY